MLSQAPGTLFSGPTHCHWFQPAELAFTLLPVSYLFPASHRIRVAFVGADKDHFEPLPGPVPEWQVFRNREHPSQIALPLMRR